MMRLLNKLNQDTQNVNEKGPQNIRWFCSIHNSDGRPLIALIHNKYVFELNKGPHESCHMLSLRRFVKTHMKTNYEIN